MRLRSLHLLICLGLLCGFFAGAQPALAQGVRIVFPQPNQQVRGEIIVRFEGIPEGGYAVVKLDGQLLQATSDNNFTLNTFNYPDGARRIDIKVIGAGGRVSGSAEVSFEIANTKVATDVPGVPLAHWEVNDIYNDKVTRYRVFAESIASVSAGAKAGEAAAGGGGGEGGGLPTIQFIPAPLDWQVVALIRSKIRDVGLIDDSANIKYVVQLAQQRQRLSESGGGGAGGGGGGAGGAGEGASVANTADPAYIALLKRFRGKPPAEPILAPWSSTWEIAPETGEYRTRMVTQGGQEIRATRKDPAIGLADLLPSFPGSEVRPGSTWKSQMTLLGELSTREAVEVVSEMTFTTFENIRTPAGNNIRAAKMEARFRLPEGKSKDIAANLIPKIGGGEGGAAGGGAAGGAADGGQGALPPELAREILLETISPARTTITRVLWFDTENRRVVRTEDTLNTYFEFMPLNAEAGGGAGGEAAEPTKVNYNLRATMWLDDSIPAPTDRYNAGAGTPHSRDAVQDPGITRVTGGTTGGATP